MVAQADQGEVRPGQGVHRFEQELDAFARRHPAHVEHELLVGQAEALPQAA